MQSGLTPSFLREARFTCAIDHSTGALSRNAVPDHSLCTQSFHNIDPHRAPRRDITRQAGNSNNARCGQDIGPRIDRAHLEEQRGHEPHGGERDNESDPDADCGKRQSLPDKHRGNGFMTGAQREPDADLARSLRDCVRNDTVDAEDAEE